MEYGATVWDPYKKYNNDKVERVQCRAARFVKSRYSRYTVFLMLDVLGWTPLTQTQIAQQRWTYVVYRWLITGKVEHCLQR